MQVEGLLVQRHAAGLDAREIQHVIDHADEVFAGALDQIHVSQSLRIAGLLADHAHHPQDPVQRRAHLMAHGGHEAALHLAQRLRLGQGLCLCLCELIRLKAQLQQLRDAPPRSGRFEQQGHHQSQHPEEAVPADVVLAARGIEGIGQHQGHDEQARGPQVHVQHETAQCRHADQRADGDHRHLQVPDRCESPAQGAPEQCIKPGQKAVEGHGRPAGQTPGQEQPGVGGAQGRDEDPGAEPQPQAQQRHLVAQHDHQGQRGKQRAGHRHGNHLVRGSLAHPHDVRLHLRTASLAEGVQAGRGEQTH